MAHVALRGPATAEELLAYVAERVAPYKRLRAVRITESVPRSPAGKLLRRVLVDAERAAPVTADDLVEGVTRGVVGP